jgi:lipopolysaccharide export LptBFGC system permease protein LptF
MAFGGMFRPITRQGIDVSQIMVILVNLMPAMLAYAIPIAALFAAVLVYWRMSTDNELTACRAGGISFVAIVTPAFALGLVVAIIDLLFVNYVVPQFLQKTERAVLRDLGSLIVSQVGRQERFQYDRLMVTADSAELLPDKDPDVSVVVLHGFAAFMMDSKNKPIAAAVGQEARLTIHNLEGQNSAEIDVQVTNASGFNPANAFQKVSGSIQTISPDGKPWRVPSYFKSKPKFLNWKALYDLSSHPENFATVSDVEEGIEAEYEYDVISNNLLDWWKTENARGNGRVEFMQTSLGGSRSASKNKIVLQATTGIINPKGSAAESLGFAGGPGGRVRVEQWVNDKMTLAYTCDAANVVLSRDQYTNTGVSVALNLRGNVIRENHAHPGVDPVDVDAQTITGIIVDPKLKQVQATNETLRAYGADSKRPEVARLVVQRNQRTAKLYQTIDSELNSRGSFSLSCLTLVLLGAGLGILLHGQNPLAVFVMGSLPAIVLVLLITAGRMLTEGSAKNVAPGLVMIWAGNLILLVIVAGVYAKLLRR